MLAVFLLNTLSIITQHLKDKYILYTAVYSIYLYSLYTLSLSYIELYRKNLLVDIKNRLRGIITLNHNLLLY